MKIDINVDKIVKEVTDLIEYEKDFNKVMETLDEIIKKMKEYNIKSIEDFEPKFYIANLKNGYLIEQKAISNLKERYSNLRLILIENYDEIGIVEYVADNHYHLEYNKIIPHKEY